MTAKDWVPIAISLVALCVAMQTKWQQDRRRQAKVKVSFRQATHAEQFEDYMNRAAASPDLDAYDDPDPKHASVVGLRIRNAGKGEARALKVHSTGVADEGKWFARISKDSLLPNDAITPTLRVREFDGAGEIWVKWVDDDGAQKSTVKVPAKQMGILTAVRKKP